MAFFVPSLWKWLSYIDASATELQLALRATNFFFSLSLILFGLIDVLIVNTGKANRYSIFVVLAASTVLWAARVAMQLGYPQGSASPILQYGMLTAFIAVALCYAASAAIVLLSQ
jgi:hypothetical protein